MRGAYRGALVAEDGARELVEVAERVETAAFAELGAEFGARLPRCIGRCGYVDFGGRNQQP